MKEESKRRATFLMQDALNKMDQMAKDLKTDDERKVYEIVRDLFCFVGTLAVDFVYREDDNGKSN